VFEVEQVGLKVKFKGPGETVSSFAVIALDTEEKNVLCCYDSVECDC